MVPVPEPEPLSRPMNSILSLFAFRQGTSQTGCLLIALLQGSGHPDKHLFQTLLRGLAICIYILQAGGRGQALRAAADDTIVYLRVSHKFHQ